MADEIVRFEDNQPETKNKRGAKKEKRWAFPLGLLIAVLTVVGLVTVITAGIGGVKTAVDRAKHVDDYNTMLVPVVMNDPDMFDDITKADMNQLLDISIWSILKSNLSPDSYQYSEGNMIIPEEDVSAEFAKLFGTEITPSHSTVTGYGYDFEYNAAEKHYIIPLTGIEPTYTPKVVDVDKKGNTRVLTVAYLASAGWAQSSDGKMVAPEPEKYVKITLRENETGYYISAMQMASAPETATTQPSAEPETTTEPETEAPTEAPSEETPAETEAPAGEENQTAIAE